MYRFIASESRDGRGVVGSRTDGQNGKTLKVTLGSSQVGRSMGIFVEASRRVHFTSLQVAAVFCVFPRCFIVARLPQVASFSLSDKYLVFVLILDASSSYLDIFHEGSLKFQYMS